MDIQFVRDQFPALKRDFIFMDNAGGSQTLSKVAQRISGYLLHHNVQLGASYKISQEATEKLAFATKKVAQALNTNRPEEVVFGPSTSMLIRILSICISQQWKSGDEIIVTNTDHEANVSPWTDLEEKGLKVKIWKANPKTFELEIEDLKKLLSDRTKLVAVTHVSNILGTINPIAGFSKIVHQAGALMCVDGVAYAPHRRVDVQDLDVDFYIFSWYKAYGPHLAVMYGRYDLLYEMKGINHYFFKKEDVPYKFQPGNFNFELTYSLLGILEYLEEFFKYHFPREKSLRFSKKLDRTFSVIASHEEKLSQILLQFLNQQPQIRIIGYPAADQKRRVPTISFVHETLNSNNIVAQVDAHRIGIRYGDFYAKKLIQDYRLEEKNGVVRVSLVHYNTTEEVKKLIKVFKKIF